MPELPEVETIRRQLDAKMRGRQVTALDFWKTGREQPEGSKFIDGVVGRTFEAVERRAKLLVFKFTDGGAMLGHLKMTGKFLVVDEDYRPNKHDRALFVFDDGGRMVWSDVRMFGFVKLVTSTELDEVLAAYGPEPLIASIEELAERLRTPKTRMLKAALLDQTCIAGIGNIYADEVCHRAGVLPTRRLATLSDGDRLRLAVEIKNVLNDSLAVNGTSASDYVDANGEKGSFQEVLKVYGRGNLPCRTCDTPITKTVLAQRGTHYCSKCQI